MGRTGVGTLRVLLIGHPDGGRELSGWINDQAHVEQVDTLDAAVIALRAGSFDVVVSNDDCRTSGLGERSGRQTDAILESLGQSVGVVDRSGHLVWGNREMRALPEQMRAEIVGCCQEVFEWAQRHLGEGVDPAHSRRFSLSGESNKYYDLTITPILDQDEQPVEAAVVLKDTTRSRRLQDRIDAIDHAGQELVNLEAEQISRLGTQERLDLLEQKILKYVHDLLHFDNFAIMALDKQTKKLRLVLSSGLPSEMEGLELDASNQGAGISGHVAASGRSYICPDVTKDSRYMAGIQEARSSLSVPLWMHNELVGVANFESTKVAAFSEDDRQFAEIFGRYVALALHILQLLVSERYATSGRVGTDVMAEITAPLNDILSDVERLVEDYIGHDDLRHRLRAVSENAVRIRESIRAVVSKEPRLVGGKSARAKTRDPVLAGRRVLVVDDEDVIRETLRDVLVGYGCVVHSAADGAEALTILETEAFDLVVSDIKLPEKNGYEVFAATKDANPDTPVIFMTGFGYDPNHAIVRARREGLAAVLFKPFKVDQLLDEVRMAIKSTQPKS